MISLIDLDPLKFNPRLNIKVGELPLDVVQRMGWTLPFVYLNGERLAHILEPRHGVNDMDVCLIPYALANGLLLQERDRPERLVASVIDPNRSDRRLKAAMKVLAGGEEIWISTFYEQRPRQTRAILSKSEVLRKHV